MFTPLTVTVLALDALALLALLGAAVPALRVLGAAAEGTGAAARRAGARSARVAWACFALGTLLATVAVAEDLPGRIDGAMCGSGVVEAMAGAGERAVLLRIVALAALAAFALLDGLARRDGGRRLEPPAARAVLLGVAALPLAGWAGYRAFGALGGSGPVDCCTAVYAPAAGDPAADGLGGWLGGAGWLSVTVLLAGLLVVPAWRVARGGRGAGAPRVLAWGGPLFAGAGGAALWQVLAAYHLGEAAHTCGWCLFRGASGRVGYPLVAALAVVGFAGPAAALAARFGGRGAGAARRVRRAGVAVLAGLGAYLLLALGPAVVRLLWHGGSPG